MRRNRATFTGENRAKRRAARRAALRAERQAKRRTRRPLLGAAFRLAATSALLTSVSVLAPKAAHAATFEVTNLDDAGAGSLREAIAAANAAAGPDVITFAAGVTGKITLSSGQLTITDSLQIVGPGRGVLAVDGGATSRVLDIPLSTGDVAVSISGLTITNGKAASGAGIRVQDESLSLDDVALTGNTATGNGGGLFADGFAMTLTVRNSTISGNTGRTGGGAYVEDTGGATVFDTVVIDRNTASAAGGGVFLYDPDNDVVVNNATITNNTAQKGGGIYLYSQDGGSFTISNSTISGNRATTGGGVYLYDIDHPVSISNSTISGNTANNGAGINIDRISAPAVISNSTISGNTATGSGGGVRLARGGGLSIANSTITANSAAEAGGTKSPGPITFSHTIIAGNTAATTADLSAAGGVTSDFSILGTTTGTVTDGGGTQVGVTNPMLAPLANNGGSTQTHVPLATSPAIDTGNPAASAPATDQRGMPRPAGTMDIGAVEVQGSTMQFDTTSVTVGESATTLAVSVTRTGTADLAASVGIATTNGTATAPGDYSAVSSQLTWAAHEIGTKTINIPIGPDTVDEANETFFVTLAGSTGGTIGTNGSLAVTIVDDDEPAAQLRLVGFKAPIIMGSRLNTVTGGSTVPFGFEVFNGPTELTDTAIVQSFTWAKVPCTNLNAAATETPITQFTSGKNEFRYDADSGQFILTWKTPTKPARSCYRVTMSTVDGSSLVAYFRLK